MIDIEERISELYLKLLKKAPQYVNWKVVCHPNILQAAKWSPGDLITQFRIPIESDMRIQVGNNSFQSDIWVVGKLRQRRKFRRYKRS